MTLIKAVTWPRGAHVHEESGLSQSPQHSPPTPLVALGPDSPQPAGTPPPCHKAACGPPGNQPGSSTALCPSRLGLLDKMANGVPAVAIKPQTLPRPQHRLPYKPQAPATDFRGYGQFLMFSWVQVQGLAKMLGSLPKGDPADSLKETANPSLCITSQG